MIAKITRGSDAGQLAGYLHGPGRSEEHVYAQRRGGAVIGGNLGLEGDREGGTWAVALTDAAKTRPSITKAVWHASLRTAPGDRVLSDTEWAGATRDFAAAMGFEDHPWVVVRHAPDHVHIALSRVDFEGKVWRGAHDYRAAQAACTQLEVDLGLTAAPWRTSEVTRRAPDHQLTAGEWRRGQRTARAPERVVLAEAVRTAAAAVAGQGREKFEAALDALGVRYRANTAVTTEKVSGYSFHLPGHTDPTGEAVWFKSSQLDRDLSWTRLAPVLETPLALPVVQVPKRRLETDRHHQKRTADAQAVAAAERATAALAGVGAALQQRVGVDETWWAHRHAHAKQAVAARAAAEAGRARVRQVMDAMPPLTAQALRAARAAAQDPAQAGRTPRPYLPPPAPGRDRGPSR